MGSSPYYQQGGSGWVGLMQPSVEVVQPVGVVINVGGDQSNKNGGLVEDQSRRTDHQRQNLSGDLERKQFLAVTEINKQSLSIRG